jgi:hypothetical protein
VLENYVKAYTATGETTWNGIATTCHFSTLFWLFEAVVGHPPASQDEYLAAFDSPFQILGRIMAKGHPIKKPGWTGLSLKVGSIIVFEHNGMAVHSCVAISAHKIGGYNQHGWFKTAGVSHGYSVHKTKDLRWCSDRTVEGTGRASECNLWQVPEADAQAIVRACVG